MTARDVFGVIVRAVGLLMILGGGGLALALLMAHWAGGVVTALAESVGGSLLSSPDLWGSLTSLAVGVYLLRGAPGIISFAYPAALPNRGLESAARAARPEQPAA